MVKRQPAEDYISMKENSKVQNGVKKKVIQEQSKYY
jgi:hypothetical protein